MSYSIFKNYGLDNIREDVDGELSVTTPWEFVQQKNVLDSDGFVTDYTWYTNGDKHIFMFGDEEIYTPDEMYADHVCESDTEAEEWFNSYEGFAEDFDDPFDNFKEDDFENTPTGNADFMIEGLQRVYGLSSGLKDLNESIQCRGKSING